MTTCEEQLKTTDVKVVFFTSMIAGGVAGTIVDVSLFPLDTLKTRLQSEQGFMRSGGFSSLYKGVLTALLGSAPTASLFFVTYESIKATIQPTVPERYQSLVHMGAASLAEVVACLIRVPVEVRKQRKQALLLDNNRNGLRILYRGYWSTVLRDMPFSLLQFPLWEFFKKGWSLIAERDTVPMESALCGAVAGSISAAATTPLDVIKTRIMLAKERTHSSELRILYILQDVWKEKGVKGLFAGIGPRVTWITIGGFIFFGAYEQARIFAMNCLLQPLSISKENVKY